jgi:hypothetical protein
MVFNWINIQFPILVKKNCIRAARVRAHILWFVLASGRWRLRANALLLIALILLQLAYETSTRLRQ